MKLFGEVVYVFEKDVTIKDVSYCKHYAKIDDIKFIVFAPCHLNVGDKVEYKLTNYIPPYNPVSKEVRKNNIRVTFVKLMEHQGENSIKMSELS